MTTQWIGLPWAKLQQLSGPARQLYNHIYDYCTYASDPQYQRLHQFRMQINQHSGTDRDLLIEYFNADPAICWPGISCDPWQYYAAPY